MMNLYTYSHFSSKHPRPQHIFFLKVSKNLPLQRKDALVTSLPFNCNSALF